MLKNIGVIIILIFQKTRSFVKFIWKEKRKDVFSIIFMMVLIDLCKLQRRQESSECFMWFCLDFLEVSTKVRTYCVNEEKVVRKTCNNLECYIKEADRKRKIWRRRNISKFRLTIPKFQHNIGDDKVKFWDSKLKFVNGTSNFFLVKNFLCCSLLATAQCSCITKALTFFMDHVILSLYTPK